jgi:hypothetical protein
MRVLRPQRAPVFIGCEGASEAGYVRWLGNMVRDRDLPFHLEVVDLGLGAGDPLARVEKAADRLGRIEANKQPFVGRFLLLDTDQLALHAQRAQQARQLAAREKFAVIWQEPTHEAFLLRHFPNCLNHRPPTARIAEDELQKRWADYRKPRNAAQVEAVLTLDGARVVAGSSAALRSLLDTIGLFED